MRQWSSVKALFRFLCVCCCSRCCPSSRTAPASSTRWATGSWGWRTIGGSTWSNGTPLSWGTRPRLSPTRLKFRAGMTSAGVHNPKLSPVTQEKMVSSKLCLSHQLWAHLHFLRWTSHPQSSFGTVSGKLCQVKSSASSFPPTMVGLPPAP